MFFTQNLMILRMRQDKMAKTSSVLFMYARFLLSNRPPERAIFFNAHFKMAATYGRRLVTSTG